VDQDLLSAGSRAGDVRVIRRTLAAEARFQPSADAPFFLGILFGLVFGLVTAPGS
jgi:hypothetical protein